MNYNKTCQQTLKEHMKKKHETKKALKTQIKISIFLSSWGCLMGLAKYSINKQIPPTKHATAFWRIFGLCKK